MALLRVETSKEAAEGWLRKLKWEPRDGGKWWYSPATGAKAAFYKDLYVNVPDAKRGALAVSLKLGLKRDAIAVGSIPDEIREIAGEVAVPAARERAPEPAPATPASKPKDESTLQAVERAASPVTSKAPAVIEAEPSVSIELAPGEEDAEVGAAIEGVGAGIAEAAEEAERLERLAKKAEEARGKLEEYEAEAAAALAQRAEDEQEALSALKALDVPVGEAPVPKEGFVVRAVIASDARMSRRVAASTLHYTDRQLLPKEEQNVIDSTRKNIDRAVHRAGGTDFLGMKLIPPEKLQALFSRLREEEDNFKQKVKDRITDRRDDLNRVIAKEIREQEKREATDEDLIPENFHQLLKFKIMVVRVRIPEAEDLADANVTLRQAKGLLADVYDLARDEMEQSLLKRFEDVYDGLADAFSKVGNGRTLPKNSRESIEARIDAVERADIAKNPTVRTHLDKVKSILGLIVRASEAGGFEKVEAAAVKGAVERVVAVSAAASPITRGEAVHAPAITDATTGLKVLTQQLKADAAANERKYGVSQESGKKGKVSVKDVPEDGSVSATTMALRALAHQFGRFQVK